MFATNKDKYNNYLICKKSFYFNQSVCGYKYDNITHSVKIQYIDVMIACDYFDLFKGSLIKICILNKYFEVLTFQTALILHIGDISFTSKNVRFCKNMSIETSLFTL